MLLTEDEKLLFKKIKLKKTQPEFLEEYITKKGNNINITNNWGETLLHNCCKHNTNLKLLDWLYNNGCKMNPVNKRGETPYDSCLKYNHKKDVEKVLEWLYEKDCKLAYSNNNGEPFFHNLVINHPTSKIYDWALKKFDINLKDDDDMTPLHISCNLKTTHNSPLPTKLLCEYGANPNIQDIYGNTPVHYCCLYGFYNCLSNFKLNEVDFKIKNNEENTPLDLINTINDEAYIKYNNGNKKNIDKLKELLDKNNIKY